MASILESLSSTFGPDALGTIGKALGTDSTAISRGLGAAGPLVMGGMARMAGTPGGLDALMKMIPKDGGGLLGNVGNMIGSVLGGGAGAAGNPLSAVLGPGANAIGSALSRKLGFNVTPLIGMVVPALLGVVSKMMKSGNIDSSRLASTLVEEQQAALSKPENSEAAALVSTAMAAGDRAAATIASYGADWSTVVAGPVAALLAVAVADLSGPLGSIKEAQAANQALLDAANAAAPDSVLAAAFGSGLSADMARTVKSLAPTREKLLDVIKAGTAAVAARSPAELPAYKATVHAVAKATAEAAKDGGFLGIGGTLVSKDEQEALDTISAALA